MVINAHDCYLPSHLLKNINAQTLHVRADKSWAEGIEEKYVFIVKEKTLFFETLRKV